MIRNIPTHQEFENLGIQCISKAFEMLFAVGDKYADLSMDETIGEEVTQEDYWKHNEITVRTSLIVLFQGIEYLMKMEVAKESALLLLENNRTDWPTLPSKNDKDYDQLSLLYSDLKESESTKLHNPNFPV